MSRIYVSDVHSRRIRRFNTYGRTVEFRIKPIPDGENPINWIRGAINEVISQATENLLPDDRVGFTFCSRDFKDGQGWLSFRPASEITSNDIWNLISSLYQSNSVGLTTETFCLNVTSVRLPVGRGKNSKYNNFSEKCLKKRSIITIKNNDRFCLARAIVTAIAFLENSEYKATRLNIGNLQLQKAIKLLEESNVDIPESGAGVEEIGKIQNFLKDKYKITVYSNNNEGRDVIFEGPDSEKRINLLFYNAHFNVIKSLTGAFSCHYYCEDCHTPYSNKNNHNCAKSCAGCQKSPPCEFSIKVKCNDCLRYFRNQTCFNNHKEVKSGPSNEKSICSLIKLCKQCFKTVSANRKHICGEIFCKICYKFQPNNHLCFMRKDNRTPTTEDFLYIFYDLETRQDKIRDENSVFHHANLCVFKQCCDKCINSDCEICIKCGKRLQILSGDKCVEGFLTHVFDIRKIFKKVIVIAHNGQAFDHQFILHHIVNETDITPEVIMRGLKLVVMNIGNVRLLDSLNYFAMSLAKIPMAFGFAETFKKGYFPHLFNRKENENYVGVLPAVEYYSPDTMKKEDRTEFMQWYEDHKNEEFNMQRDIVHYCVMDVEILTQACLKFRGELLTTSNVCPFTDATTIASATNLVFRRNCLQENTIGVIPRGGYRYRDNQSAIAIIWLLWEEHQRKIEINHAAKQHEVILHGVKVDGYSPITNQCFFFHGCWYHGHPECYIHQRENPCYENSNETLQSRYESTLEKTGRLKSFGFEVIEMWECKFRQQMQENKAIEEYTKDHPLASSKKLDPREAFYGGRTGNCKTYYKAKEHEKIKYLDVCSLYPWVCKYGKFPVGHPEVIVGDPECKKVDLKYTDGLITCDILPPNNLYHPVLPVKMNNKLMFVLCRTCGENMLYDNCEHTAEQKTLSGTWVIDEVLKAIETGYTITKIHEIWKYNVVQYNAETKKGGLFVDMMNKFMKIKQEASGFPASCENEEEKKKYVADYFKNEGIQLEYEKICKNPGLRSQAKLVLNSFWGKLGQSERLPKTKLINTPEELYSMITKPEIIVNSLTPVNEKVMVVNYEYREETYEALPTVNVCLAAYTTAQARLKLYSYLEKLQERVLYYDTDSVIYVHSQGEYEPSTGDYVGEMTDELEEYGIGSFIMEFVSGGPKNYSYKLWSTRKQQEILVCKVKGISLNYEASKLVNFNSIKDMVLDENLPPLKITSKNIKITENHEVITKKQEKIYRPNSLKRKFDKDHNSLPFGYKHSST